MRSLSLIHITLLPALLTGCLFLPGRDGLARLLEERGAPYARTRFSVEPAPDDRPLAELRATLEYWSQPGAGGIPRWEGVLQPEPKELYRKLIGLIDSGTSALTLVAYRYDAAGLDDLTLVDYLDEGETLIGYDYVVYPETSNAKPRHRWVGYDDLVWWEFPQMLLDVPVYLAVGLKELVGEVIKSPVSLVDSMVIGPIAEGRHVFSPVSLKRGGLAVTQDWRNGLTALTWRFRTRHRHTPLDLVRDLLGAVPIVGPLFDHRSPPESSGSPPDSDLVAISQGIHAGDATEQFAEAWRRRLEEVRPGTPAVTVPYRYGGVADVIWSILNISHGFGYDMAADIVFVRGVEPGDAVDLAGFSGGGQRAVVATRALRSAGVRVNRMMAVAGPVAGNSCASKSTALLRSETLRDPVVFTARLVNSLYVFLPNNVAVISVADAGGHHMPYFPNGLTRAPEVGYSEPLEAVLRD